MGLRSFLPQVSRLPGLRPDDVDVLPGDGPADPGLPQGPDARAGARRTPASRSCGSRSWAASSTARASRSTPTSGSSLPGTFEEPVAPVFIDGSLDRTLRGDGLVAEFIEHPRGLRRPTLPGAARGGPSQRRRRLRRGCRSPRDGRRRLRRPRSRVYTPRATERPLRDVGDPHVSFCRRRRSNIDSERRPSMSRDFVGALLQLNAEKQVSREQLIRTPSRTASSRPTAASPATRTSTSGSTPRPARSASSARAASSARSRTRSPR